VERRLLECVMRGEWLDLVQDESRNGADTRWEALYELDASIIRDLLRGRLVADPDPHGVRVRGVRLRGTLDLEGLSTTINLQLRDSFLPDGVDASGARLNVLRLDGCEVRSAPGPAIAAERLIASELTMVGAVLSGHGAAGAVNLRGAQLDRLICDDARLSNDSGPALRADSLRVDQEVLLRGRFEASGSGEHGAVYLLGARTARLECDGATLCNASGPALRADSIQVDQRAFLWRGFTATGSGELGAVRLNGSRIGIFSVRESAITNNCGPALVAESAQVERGFLADEASLRGAGPRGVLRLTGTRIGGQFRLDIAQLRNLRQSEPVIALDGLTYTGIPDGAVNDWLRLLRYGTARYSAQPYQQLAAVYRTAGHDREVREILVAQRDDQVKRGGLGAAAKAWAALTRVTLGYGYKPWRALVGLLVVVVCAVALSLIGGANGGLEQKTDRSDAMTYTCTWVQQVGVGVDLALPIIKTGAGDQCRMTDAAAGQWLTAVGWILQILAWAFATLFVAGFTSAVRKT
jgi:uncharacterized protein YjbI with pentapeptide repeats